MALKSRWAKLALALYLLVVHLLALLFVLEQVNGKKEHENEAASSSAGISADSIKALSGPARYTDTGRLMIPVAGVKQKDLQDTYTQSRSGGRVHNAIDIMAAEGTPVVAATDGEIAKFFESRMGGTTIYQWGAGRKRVYYYAHLQRRAEGIAEKSFVRRGTVIGYVGNTGDAGPGNYHLHFSISLPESPDRHWGGTDINPYPILKDGIEVPAGMIAE